MTSCKHSIPRSVDAADAKSASAMDWLGRSRFSSVLRGSASASVFLGKAIGVVLCLASLPLANAIGDNHIAGPLNEHSYELVEVETGMTWHEAKAAAEARSHNGLPGYLATITTAEEHAFVTEAFPRIEPEHVWLGADDEESEGRFTWITGESALYRIGSAGMYEAWAPGEPNGGVYENCLNFADNSIHWNDENCDRRLNFYLVEYSAPILVTLYSWGTGRVQPVAEDPGISGYIPAFGLTDYDADMIEPALFDEMVVPLADIPKYLNATASTDPDFGAVTSGMGDDSLYTAFGLFPINAAGDQVGGWYSVNPNWSRQELIGGEFQGDMVERIEFIIGDQTFAYYDEETRTYYSGHQVTVNVYGATKQFVQIDIKPFDDRNKIDPSGPMLFSLAILSDEDFDALQTDLQTIVLEPGEARARNYRVYDANRDRVPDLVPLFRARDLRIGCGQTEVELTGKTHDGMDFFGTDVVINRRCPK